MTGSSLGSYGLTVNGAPYQMKGVTWGPSNAAASAYMPDLQSMGVNTIRTWGTDATTQPLLDAAAPYGIKVITGFWLSQTEDYINDTSSLVPYGDRYDTSTGIEVSGIEAHPTLGAGYRTDPGSWPSVGETDIMEDVNARSESSETLHCGTAPGGNCDEYNGLTSGLSTCSGCQAGYHTYSEIIDRTNYKAWLVPVDQRSCPEWSEVVK